ncbi:MAG TPA: PepSY-associated TM helix domain-containing protein [Candidatus Didemnitutus sp.]|nr:PepSY-associated TM helix domain-containing protein [Candidatus Didemnitutus sp.]
MPASPSASRFRPVLFWTHLACGVIAGLVIGLLCFTGATLAFENELVAWSERDARRIVPPADAKPLSVEELSRKVRAAQPDARPSAIVVSADLRDAVAFQLGRDSALYVNPYTGEIRSPASTRMRAFLQRMEELHRWLALGDDSRAVGKAVTGACNLAFFILASSGLYLWMPRGWSWRSVKAIALFNWRLTGKARDFNWHNTIGLWSAPILIVLTLTAVPMSYRWGANLIYQIAGEPAPTQPQSGPAAVEVPKPEPGRRPLGYDSLLASAQAQFPRWELITLRLGGGQRGAGAATGPAVNITVKESGSWPRTATTNLWFNPYTGDILKREGYAELPTSRQIRSWTRFLHTGQALGGIGQLAAGLACLGGCVLVYTGLALAWRRFFGRSTGTPLAPKNSQPLETVS